LILLFRSPRQLADGIRLNSLPQLMWLLLQFGRGVPLRAPVPVRSACSHLTPVTGIACSQK